MKKKLFYFLVILAIFLNSTGCVPLIIGGAAGALGAYAVSRDTIQADTDQPYESLWNAALTVARIRGSLKQEDYTAGSLEFNVDTSRVWIRLVRVTHATTRLKISARKHHLPHLALAQDIYVKVIEEAR